MDTAAVTFVVSLKCVFPSLCLWKHTGDMLFSDLQAFYAAQITKREAPVGDAGPKSLRKPPRNLRQITWKAKQAFFCRRQWKELEHSDLRTAYVTVYPPFHILSISVLFHLKLTLQVILSHCEIFRHEMQSYFLCTVLSIISSVAFITYCVCISFLLSVTVSPSPYGKFMKMFLKEFPGPPLPC